MASVAETPSRSAWETSRCPDMPLTQLLRTLDLLLLGRAAGLAVSVGRQLTITTWIPLSSGVDVGLPWVGRLRHSLTLLSHHWLLHPRWWTRKPAIDFTMATKVDRLDGPHRATPPVLAANAPPPLTTPPMD